MEKGTSRRIVLPLLSCCLFISLLLLSFLFTSLLLLSFLYTYLLLLSFLCTCLLLLLLYHCTFPLFRFFLFAGLWALLLRFLLRLLRFLLFVLFLLRLGLRRPRCLRPRRAPIWAGRIRRFLRPLLCLLILGAGAVWGGG